MFWNRRFASVFFACYITTKVKPNEMLVLFPYSRVFHVVAKTSQTAISLLFFAAVSWRVQYHFDWLSWESSDQNACGRMYIVHICRFNAVRTFNFLSFFSSFQHVSMDKKCDQINAPVGSFSLCIYEWVIASKCPYKYYNRNRLIFMSLTSYKKSININ